MKIPSAHPVPGHHLQQLQIQQQQQQQDQPPAPPAGPSREPFPSSPTRNINNDTDTKHGGSFLLFAVPVPQLHGRTPNANTTNTKTMNTITTTTITTTPTPMLSMSPRADPSRSPTSPSVASPTGRFMPLLSDVLARLGLSQYAAVLDENGFTSWAAVLDITEEDFVKLRFKLGHRRCLQREIATFRGLPQTFSLELDGVVNGNGIPSPCSFSPESIPTTNTSPPVREKRRYRRHPRPDSNAPKKPKTAYVNFADHLRTDPAIASLSFVDIAKEVGRRWQDLPPEQKRMWESQAARAMQEFEMQMDEYKKTDLYRNYQAYLKEFKSQQGQPTGKRATGIAAASPSPARSYPRGSPSSPDGVATPQSSGSEAEQCHNGLTLAFSELVALRGEILDQSMQPYDESNLPPEDLTRRAIYAFIRGTGSLIFTWTYAQADDILNRIYRPQQPIDALTLAECFSIAAMGAHYDLDCFPDRVRKLLYASATLHFNEKTARFDYLRTMRILLSMSVYALLEKHMSARYLVDAGLQIARWKCPFPSTVAPNAADEGWRKIFRSLIFLDCWLAYTLGYISTVPPEDIAFACSPFADAVTVEEVIHMQTSRIGVIAAEIARALSPPEAITPEIMSLLKWKLETWRSEVPDALQISALTSTQQSLTLYQKRAILMVHIMYFGAVILLYRQLLLDTAGSQLDGTGDLTVFRLSPDQSQLYGAECAMAAQQIVRTLRLISFDGTLTRRCWITIYWSFSAGVILLFSAMMKLMEGLADDTGENLNYAKGCIDLLEPSCTYEPIALKYMCILRPLYDSIRDIHQRTVGRAKTSLFALLQPTEHVRLTPPTPVSREEIRPVFEKLAELVTDPFGRKELVRDEAMRRIIGADGTSLVFWWK